MAKLSRATFIVILCLSLLVSVLPIIFSASPALAAASTSVHVVKYYADGTTVLNETTVNYSWMESNLPVWGDGIIHYYHQGPVFKDNPDEATEQLIRWNSSEDTNVQEKDMGAVKGTNVKDLCDLVGGASAGDTIRIKANDGLAKNFSYENVYNYSSREGPIVLTWYCTGLASYSGPYPDTGYSDGMRLVWFADDSVNPWGIHAFGNWDWHEAADPKYWYYYYGSPSEKYPTTTGLSVKWVSEIIIYTDEPTPTPSVSPTVSPTPTASPTRTPTPTTSPTKTTPPTVSVTKTPTPSVSPTPTISPTVTPTASPTTTTAATQTTFPSVTPTMTNTTTLTSSPTTTGEPETTPDSQLPGSGIIGSSGGNTSSADGNIFVVFPPDAVDQNTVITVSPMYGEFGIGQTYFAITASADGVPVTTLGVNVTICVRYTNADLDSVGGDPDHLQLAYYDEEAAKWIALDTTVDPDQRIACASTNHLSEWTFLKVLPNSLLPWWIWLIVASMATGLITVIYLIYSRRNTAKEKSERGKIK